jgi:hypothetical protein
VKYAYANAATTSFQQTKQIPYARCAERIKMKDVKVFCDACGKSIEDSNYGVCITLKFIENEETILSFQDCCFTCRDKLLNILAEIDFKEDDNERND